MNTPQLTSGWVRKFSMLGGRNECRAWSRHTTARCLYLYMKSSYKEPGSGSGLWLFIPFTWPSSKCSPQEGLNHIFRSVVSPLFYPHQTCSPHPSFGRNLRRNSTMEVSVLIQAQTEKGHRTGNGA